MDKEINESLAKLFLSTRKRSNRLLTIDEIADEILLVSKYFGNLHTVGEKLGISVGMLNQFLSVKKLDISLKKLVNERKIDSVSIVFSLSRIPASIQNEFADLIVSGELNSQDLKAIIPLMKQYKELPIKELLNKFHQSKNVKISIINFFPEDLEISKESFLQRMESLIDKKNIHSINLNTIPCSLKITKEGESLLRKEAKVQKITLRELIIKLMK